MSLSKSLRSLRLSLPLLSSLLMVSALHCASAQESDLETAITQVSGTISNPDSSPAVDASIIVMSRYESEPLAQGKTNNRGEFQLQIGKDRSNLRHTAFFRVESGDLLALVPLGVTIDGETSVLETPYELKLSSVVETPVRIVDSRERPVADANVVVQTGSYTIRLNTMTDSDGVANIALPPSMDVSRILAWKDETGFGYRSYVPDRRGDDIKKKTVPLFDREGETVKLSDAVTLRIRVVDGDGAPVVDHEVYPWLLDSPDSNDRLNLSFYSEFKTKTNEDGIATFSWIPTWQTKPITFWNSGGKGFTHERVGVRPGVRTDSAGVHETITINRLVQLTGRVVSESGEPVPGASVKIAGQGQERFYLTVETDETGRFEALVAPNMAYLLNAQHDEDGVAVAISDSLTGFAIFPNTPHEIPDLVMRPPATISGTVQDANGKPKADETVTIYHYGAKLDELPEDQRARLPPTRFMSYQAIQFYHPKTDENGRFEIKLGRGNYDVRPPGQRSAQRFEIIDDKPLQFELEVETPEEPQDMFAGTVTFPDGTPVVNAKIEAHADGVGSGWRATTDEKGVFAVKEIRARKTLVVTTPKTQHAAIVTVDDKARAQTIVVQEVGSATLTLVNDEDEPIANQEIVLSGILHRNERGGFRSRDVGTFQTDEQGLVELNDLIPGMMYSMRKAAKTRQSRYRVLHRFKVRPAENYVGTVTADLSPIPTQNQADFKPPTVRDRLERLLSVDGTPLARFERAIRKVEAYQQKLMIVIGNGNNDLLHQWVTLRYENPDYRTRSSDFATMVIATDRADKESFASLMKRLTIDLDQKTEFLMLVIDGQGKIAGRIDERDAVTDGVLSEKAVIDFLESHAIKLPAARGQLEAALAKARLEDKRVFVQETATWCGPCHKLTDFMLANPIWEKDYVYLRLDHRMDGAREIMKDLRAGAQGGIPWFTILDADGNRLETSNHFRNEQNIGYPSSRTGQEHFASMLKNTAQRLTEDEIESLVAKLKEE